MSTLGDAFEESYRTDEDRQLGRAACRVVEDALYPFKPGRIQLYTWDNVGYLTPKLGVVVEMLPDLVFEFVLNRYALMKDQWSYLNKFHAELFNFYRYRRSLPVDDHIVLGED